MSRYRKIDVQLWRDRKVRAMSPDAKLMWVLVLTHPQMTPMGFMYATHLSLAGDLGISGSKAKKAISELQANGLIDHDEATGLVAITNWFKFNPPVNPNAVVSWQSVIGELPSDSELTCRIVRRAWEACESRGESFLDKFREVLGTDPYTVAETDAETVSGMVSGMVPETVPGTVPAMVPATVSGTVLGTVAGTIKKKEERRKKKVEEVEGSSSNGSTNHSSNGSLNGSANGSGNHSENDCGNSSANHSGNGSSNGSVNSWANRSDLVPDTNAGTDLDPDQPLSAPALAGYLHKRHGQYCAPGQAQIVRIAGLNATPRQIDFVVAELRKRDSIKDKSRMVGLIECRLKDKPWEAAERKAERSANEAQAVHDMDMMAAHLSPEIQAIWNASKGGCRHAS